MFLFHYYQTIMIKLVQKLIYVKNHEIFYLDLMVEIFCDRIKTHYMKEKCKVMISFEGITSL